MNETTPMLMMKDTNKQVKLSSDLTIKDVRCDDSVSQADKADRYSPAADDSGDKKTEDKENLDIVNDDDIQMVEHQTNNKDSSYQSESAKKKKSLEFITNRANRLKSYVRRRPIPLKRAWELDLQCGTKSFVCQVSVDFGEVIYTGHQDLVRCFKSGAGLKLSDVNNILLTGRYQARPRGTKGNWEHDYNPVPQGELEDEEYLQDSKAIRDAESVKEAQKRSGDCEFIKNMADRLKKCKVYREGIFSKLKEIDQLTGSLSLVVVLCLERGTCYYYGHPNLLSLLFTSGLKYHELLKDFNVRKYYLNEESWNLCSVPNCVVSRNTAARWRRTAIEKYRYPTQLPVTLHPCPDEERDKWMAEIDMDPNFKARVFVCSFHFKDGYPSPENPYPSQFLGGWLNQPQYFSGKIPQTDEPEQNESEIIREFCSTLIDDKVMGEVNSQIELIEARKEEMEKKKKEREEQRMKDKMFMKTIQFYKFSLIGGLKRSRKSKLTKRQQLSWSHSRKNKVERDSAEQRKRCDHLRNVIVKKRRLRMKRIRCKFCPSSFHYTKYLFNHVRNDHVAPVRRKEEKEVFVSAQDRQSVLQALYPGFPTVNPNKKYVCAVCKTVTTLTGLFLHMNEVHNGILCQFCLKLFKRVRDLENHLNSMHHYYSRYYSSMDMFKKYSGKQVSMVCYDCGASMLMSEAETHNCTTLLHFSCPYCGETYRSKDDLEIHICRAECEVSRLKMLYKNTKGTKQDVDYVGSVTDYKTQVAYKVMTGKNLVLEKSDNVNLSQYQDTDINSMLQVNIVDTTRQHISMTYQKQPSVEPSVVVRNNLFSPFDRNTYQFMPSKGLPQNLRPVVLKNVPCLGQIFSGAKAKGLTNNVKREFKDRGHSFNITKEIEESTSEKTEKPDTETHVDASIRALRIERAGKNFIIDDTKLSNSAERENSETDDADDIPDLENMEELEKLHFPKVPQREASKRTVKPTMRIQGATQPTLKIPGASELPAAPAPPPVVTKPPEKVKVETRAERIARMETEIEDNIKKMRRVIDKFVSCLFCQQCKTVSVDVSFLLSHFHIHHLPDGVNNLMGETAQHCISRIKKYLKDTRRKEILFNYCPKDELFVLEFYRCSYCPTTECTEYPDLFKHTESAHQTKILTCNICHNIFLNYGSLISHVCTGPPTSASTRARFACKVCLRVDLHSFLEFQKHIRKEHNICEICFTSVKSQTQLYHHCTVHDQDLMCMKCFVTFEKSISLRKHLFLKHSAEQTECTSCHSPSWPHVYHFCLPDNPVSCHNCEAVLPNAAAFKVHLRQHQGTTPHICDQPNCSRSYISKSLLWKHQVRRHPQLRTAVGQLLRRRKLKKEVDRYGASDVDSVDICQQIVDQLWEGVSKKIEEMEPSQPDDAMEPEPETERKPDTPEATETSVLDAAIRSIMPESEDESKLMDTSALQDTERDAVQSTIAEKAYTEDNSWQAGIDALLAGASIKLPKVPLPSDLPPDQLFQNTDHEEGGAQTKSSDEAGSPAAPVIGGLWNQDLIFVGGDKSQSPQRSKGSRIRGGLATRGASGGSGGHHTDLYSPQRPSGGPRVRGRGARTLVPRSIRTNFTAAPPKKSEFDLNLSESSDDEDAGGGGIRGVSNQGGLIKPLLDHDYCYAAFMMSQEPPEDTREMDKIVSNVTFDRFGDSFEHSYVSPRRTGENALKKRRKSRGQVSSNSSDTSSADEIPDKVSKDVDIFGMAARSQMINTPAISQPQGFTKRRVSSTPAMPGHENQSLAGIQATSTPAVTGQDWQNMNTLTEASPAITPFLKRGPKPKYHTPDVSKFSGVTAGTARPSFDTDSSKGSDSDNDSDEEDETSEDEVKSSDLDTDFSADESAVRTTETTRSKTRISAKSKPNIKLKIKLPPQKIKERISKSGRKSKRRRKSQPDEEDAKPLSKKMRESLALNQRRASSEEDEGDTESSDEEARYTGGAGARGDTVGRAGGDDGGVEDTKLYCYCQCPHDEYSEMIGCDAPDCRLEWFHFECVNILVPPEGKWYCPECTKRYGLA